MRFLKYCKEILMGKELPVWVTLLGIFAGVVGTYYIIPVINQELEKQKIKTEFVIRNIDDLNSKTRSLLVGVGELHRQMLASGLVDRSKIEGYVSTITELQWKGIELAIIFEGTASMKVVEHYQESLDRLRIALLNLQDKTGLQASIAAASDFSRATVDVIKALARLSGINLNPALR